MSLQNAWHFWNFPLLNSIAKVLASDRPIEKTYAGVISRGRRGAEPPLLKFLLI